MPTHSLAEGQERLSTPKFATVLQAVSEAGATDAISSWLVMPPSDSMHSAVDAHEIPHTEPRFPG
jgi:hypothetical protein